MFRHDGYKPHYIEQGDWVWGIYILGHRVQGSTVVVFLFFFAITKLDYLMGPCCSQNQLYSRQVVHVARLASIAVVPVFKLFAGSFLPLLAFILISFCY